MCKFCESTNTLITKEIPTETWGQFTGYEYIAVVYDSRGYIRLGSEDDMNCLDHDEKIKANFCFNCGRKLG